MTETPASVPVSPDAAASAEHSIAAGAVYLAGPKRIQGTPFWIEAAGLLRQHFAKHRVIVAGDGTCGTIDKEDRYEACDGET